MLMAMLWWLILIKCGAVTSWWLVVTHGSVWVPVRSVTLSGCSLLFHHATVRSLSSTRGMASRFSITLVHWIPVMVSAMSSGLVLVQSFELCTNHVRDCHELFVSVAVSSASVGAARMLLLLSIFLAMVWARHLLDPVVSSS